ncbi:MAG: permease-like cell division protein FtsX [Candidatus Magasanikbacteria bacterium]|nr:permease-like cell division protein FtsX [Candidatus Magasanikbacteria bacterium]
MSFKNRGRISFLTVWGRAGKYALQNLARNIGMVFITITIVTLALVSVNALLGLRALTNAAVTAVEHQVDVSIFFTTAATPDQIQKVKDYVYQVASVSNSDYVSPDQALATFKERHSDDPDIIKSLGVLDSNPLGAILVIHAKEATDYQKILTALSADEFKTIIQKRSFEDRSKIVRNVELFTSRAQLISFGLACLFALIAILIIFNAIRVAIYTQREEIAIKKLVGATNAFIRAPFFIEVFVYVTAAFAATAGLIGALSRALDPYLGPIFTGNGFSLYEYYFGSWISTFGLQYVVVLLLAWLTAMLAMRKHLRT